MSVAAEPASKPTLLTIPWEIRHEIYIAIFSFYEASVSGEVAYTWKRHSRYMAMMGITKRLARLRPDWLDNGWLESLLVCRQIHEEAETVLYKTLTFKPAHQYNINSTLFSSLSERA